MLFGGDDDELRARILDLASSASGVDFHAYKPATIERRLRHCLHATACASLEEYRRLLETSPEHVAVLCSALLIKTTDLFREPATFEALRVALPAWLDERRAHGAPTVEAWVPGCSTGEDAYALAAVLLEAARGAASPAIRVLGSDVDPDALRAATSGNLRAPPGPVPSSIHHLFVREGERLVVTPALREATTFVRHDLLSMPRVPPAAVFRSLDIVFCRNVLLYLASPARERVVAGLADAVEPGGFLVFSDAEGHVGATDRRFARVDLRLPIYRRL